MSVQPHLITSRRENVVRERQRVHTGELLGGQPVEPDTWQRPEALTRPVQPGTAAALRQAMDALFEADATLQGGHRLTLERISNLAIQAAQVDACRPQPWVEAMMREALEDYHAEAKGRVQRYMRRGSGVTDETVTIHRQQARYP
jgi:hypothetical protein